jgi:hypothetical protein
MKFKIYIMNNEKNKIPSKDREITQFSNIKITNNSQVNSMTSLKLLDQINMFRSQEGLKQMLHKTLLNIIRSEFEQEIDEQNILPTSYQDVQGRTQIMFTLTLSQAKQVLVKESKKVRKAVIHYIEIIEAKSLPTINNSIDLEEQILAQSKFATELVYKLRQERADKELAQAQNFALKEINTHHQSVIIDMTKDVPVKTMRLTISEIVRSGFHISKGKNYISDRWNKLYKEYYYRHHKNLKERAENADMKPLDYAQEHGMIPDLYLLALDIFEKNQSKEITIL